MFSKKIVVAAALLAASAAQAQVTLYGNLDLSFGRFESQDQNFDGVAAVESGTLNESYIGFKGQEDLGGGLKAFFQLESVIGADTGTAGSDTGFWGRTSIIGLAGDFGTATLGNARTLNFLANQAYNPFGATGLLSTSSRLYGFDSNFQNSITYTSPNLSGFTAAVQIGLSENEVDGSDDDAYGLQLNYAAGPLAIGFTYEDAEDSVPALRDNSNRWQLGASYDFGAAKLFGQIGKAEINDGNDEDLKFFQIGAALPLSNAGNVLVSYAQNKRDDEKDRQLSLAYDHSLSKRTGAYVGLVHQKIEPVAAGQDDSGNSFFVGVRHSF